MAMKDFDCSPETTIRIVTSDIFSGDAIGNFNLQMRSFLQGRNIPCKLYATNFDASAKLDISHFDQFFDDYKDKDVLFSHFSIYEERNSRLAAVELPKAVYYHGITPPEYFEAYDAITAENCAKGLRQFTCFKGFDYYLSNSRYMLDELIDEISEGNLEKKRELYGRSVIIPPFIDSSQWSCQATDGRRQSDNEYSMLYVGRVAPHKCVQELFDLLSVMTKRGVKPRLHIVGSCAAATYCQELNNLLEKKYAAIKDQVVLCGHVSQSKLEEMYRTSDVFVTMSEHEGFCVPLVEAMRFSLPVLAKAKAAIPETMSGAGMLTTGNDYAAMSDYIEGLMDEEVRNEVIKKQNAVYEQLLKASDGTLILDVLKHLLALHSARA